VNVVIKETINGRAYVIEVLPVGRNRWRAQIGRHGTPTALMPFYGSTPDEAAGLLKLWLTRASQVRATDGTTAAPAAHVRAESVHAPRHRAAAAYSRAGSRRGTSR
jgi:hypothetical protein